MGGGPRIMLDELIKIDWAWFWEFVGGPKAGLAGIATAIGILGMALSFRKHNKTLPETNVHMVRMEKTMEELTDALIDNNELKRRELYGENYRKLPPGH
jgi:hypothetical protein